jgi:hypothetical protein
MRGFALWRSSVAVGAVAVWIIVGWVTDNDGPPGDLVFFLFIGYVLLTHFLAPRVRRRIESTV